MRFREFINEAIIGEQKSYDTNEAGVLAVKIRDGAKIPKKNWQSWGDYQGITVFVRLKKGLPKKLDNIYKFLKSEGFEQKGNRGFWKQEDGNLIVDVYQRGDNLIIVNIHSDEQEIMKNRRSQKKL